MAFLKNSFFLGLYEKLTTYFYTVAGHLAPEWAAQKALTLFMTPPRFQRGPTETQFWDSAQRVALPSNLDARSFGNPEGPQVWVVHGWASRSSVLRNIIEALVAHDYHVIAWDGPAHGRNPQKTTNMLQFAMLLKNDLERVGKPKVALIGHSFGAGACAYVASIHTQVTQLITIGGVPDIRTVVSNFWRRIQLPTQAQGYFLNEVQKTLGITPLEISPIHFYPQVQARWLWIHDKEDEDVNYKGVEKFIDLNPPLKFLITEKLGHYRILKSPDVITKIIQFLKSTPMD